MKRRYYIVAKKHSKDIFYPIGHIEDFGLSSLTDKELAAKGFLRCNGAQYDSKKYPLLKKVLLDVYGTDLLPDCSHLETDYLGFVEEGVHRIISLSVLDLITLMKKNRHQGKGGFQNNMNYSWLRSKLKELGLNSDEIDQIN